MKQTAGDAMPVRCGHGGRPPHATPGLRASPCSRGVSLSARCVRLARSRASIAELCCRRNNTAMHLLQSICSTSARQPSCLPSARTLTMTSRTSPAQSSFARRPFAERFCIDCLACWHWAALARTAHSSPAIPAQTPCTSLKSCFSAFICTAEHFAGQSERRAVPAKAQQLLSAIHVHVMWTMRRPPLLHAVHHTGQFFLEGVVVQEGRRADSAEAKAKVAVCWPTLLLTAPAWRSRRAPERRYVC